MTPQQLAELLEYIQAKNSWEMNMYDVCHVNKRRAVKYVDIIFDSRDGSSWYLTFRSQTRGEDTEFTIKSIEDIRTVYEWLDETIE